MNVCVVVFVVLPERVDNRPRLLRRRRVIQIDERMSVDLLVEDREILSDRFPIYGRLSSLMHTSMCGTPRSAPPAFTAVFSMAIRRRPSKITAGHGGLASFR